ncbi:hypothetical protein TRFO_03624 [Tritrichomonas foetus]|uniref:Peptidase M60 domain-containing protein n=1 Tax=Tritrichomonas foetus TaxID=1144522 RepID=A0A1J4KNU5_9EUKA|nr:hypothetical protein TRFO_03624 [Tritrichomonas foetus]|eukprot:OHT12600.1 hypothetical protein TRFO_03624 [Tritrichomonas foetus]
MGCCNSVEAEAAHRRNRPSPKVDPKNAQGMAGGRPQGGVPDARGNNIARFDQIVSGAKMIAAPSNMMPIVCLTREAFPLITSFLHLEDSTPTEIQLPIVAGSVSNNGRVICFAQLQFLSSKALHTADTAKLISNSLNWLSGGISSMTPVLALGFDKPTMQYVMKALQDLGFFAEAGNHRSTFTNYKCIVIPSNIPLEDSDLKDNIIEYVQNGGGLAVFYIHAEIPQLTMPINKLLSPFGFSFTYCLLNEDLEDADNIQVPPSFTYVRDSNFVPISAHFKAVVKQNNIDTSTLDDLVTTLRYYIMVCDDSHSEQLQDIAHYSWDFLNRTEYSTADGICPDIKHGIVVVLLQDLYAKLSIDQVQPIPEHDVFPGKTGEVEMQDHTLTLELKDDTWVSTGLWLPASLPAFVETPDLMPDVHVQIGSQHDSLLTKQGPWKRWPSVVSVFPLEQATVKVGTPFGGIVYVTSNPPEPTEPQEVSLTFKGFCKHPRAVVTDPSIWEETKDIDVPWGELDIGNVIFTVPSDKLRGIPDFGKVKSVFEVIVSGISNYMSHTIERPYRFVFDVEIAEDGWPGYGYPLIFHVDDIDGILFNLDGPTPELFKAVSLMTIVSIREDCFDNTTETAIASVATAVIFQELFSQFDPFKFNGITLPTLFHELWEIHSHCNSDLIPQTLAKFQNPEYPVSEVPEDMWIAFVREMCRIGKRDFTKLLERSRPIPLNISISLQGLPPYQASSSS